MDKVTSNEELEEMLHRDSLTIFISDVSLSFFFVLDLNRVLMSYLNHIILQVNSETGVSGQALNQIESRHQDILSLESSITELHEIFADTAMLLESQVSGAVCGRTEMQENIDLDQFCFPSTRGS